MVLSLELRYIIIEAYYENGRSLTLVRRSLLFRGLKWCSAVLYLTNEQIKRVVNQLKTYHTLKKTSPPGLSRSVIPDKNLSDWPLLFSSMAKTIKTDNHLKMIKRKVIPVLKRRGVYKFIMNY